MFPYSSLIRPSRTGPRAPRVESRFFIPSSSLSDISEYTESSYARSLDDVSSLEYSSDDVTSQYSQAEQFSLESCTTNNEQPPKHLTLPELKPEASVALDLGHAKTIRKRASLPMMVVGLANSLIRKCRSFRVRKPRSIPCFDIIA